MKESFYFSHDYASREDEKIKKLLYKHGWGGYGLFWALIESLYQNEGYMQYECERIAFELRTDKEMIKSVIEDFDLFKIAENKFYSVSVLHRLKLRKGKSATARKAAKIRWGKEKQNYADAMQAHSEGNAIKERKGKENKGKENKDKIYPAGFEKVIEEWLEYKKQKRQSYSTEMGLQKFITRLKNLSGGDPEKAQQIIDYSMANNYAGIFELKETKKANTQRADEIYTRL